MRKRNNYLKRNSGQTIVEALVALVSIVLTLSAIAIAVTTSLSNSQFSRDQSRSSKFAQEGIEHMRYLRNTNMESFESRNGLYCLEEDNTLVSPCDDGLVNINNSFIRTVEFVPGHSECGGGTRVRVNVAWPSGKCDSSNRFCHSSELVSCFSVDQPESSSQL